MSRSIGSGRRAPSSRRGWLWWLPLVAVSADLLAEWAFNGREPVSFLLTGVPPLVAVTRGPRVTALSAVVCVGLQVFMASLRPGHIGEQHHVALYGASVLIGIVSTMLAAQRERADRNLVRADLVAEAVQRTMLRPVPQRIGLVAAAAFYSAGEGGTLVGGDLYDVCATPFGVRAVIGDVRGKGLGAVQTVAAVLGSFRVSAHEWQDLGSLADRLELSMARNGPTAGGSGETDAELFVTALVMQIPPGSCEVHIVDRGHPSPIVVGPHGAYRLETSPNLPLGLGALAGASAVTTVHPLRAGQVLLAYTDGFSEARNEHGVFYPILERLAERFRDAPSPHPEAVVSFVRQDVTRWAATSEDDDQALLALSIGQPQATASR
ncbi:PP2C family protein-serine/threonine phosphatase [Streptomyces sp. NPDC059979]|uniref:PP2C family protein-serine/threonine phosphatase n=1 Tax=Streptomyces sp. NPDC059979 TaxID=3347021 RepID=UPI0036C1DAD0